MSKKKELSVELKLLDQQFKAETKKVNSEMSSLKSEMKLVESQFKATGDKSEYLKNKSSILSKEFEIQKTKVSETEKQLDLVQKTMGKDSVEAQKMQTKLNGAKSEMYNLQIKTQVADEELNKFSTSAEKLDKVSKKSKEVSESFKVLSTTAAAVAGASVAATIHMDEGYNTIIKKTGATGDALDSLNASADNIFTSMPINMKDAGIAIGEVNTRFGETGGKLEDLSSSFLKFADINDTDLNTSIGNTQKIMSQWNIDTSQMAPLLGLITKKSQETGVSVDYLMGSLQTNGYVFKEMGLSINESVSLMADFEKSGIDSDAMLVGLKKAAANYAAEGMSMENGLSDLVLRLQDANTESVATTEVFELFGKKAGLSFITASKEGRVSFDNLSTDLENYGTVVDDTFDAMQDPWDRAKVTANNLEKAGSELGGSIFDVIAPAFEILTAAVKGTTEWFTSLDDTSKNLIAGGILLVASLSGIALGVSGITHVSSLLSTGIHGLKAAFALLSIENLKNIAESTAIYALYVKDAIVKGASTVATWAQVAATTAWNIVSAAATLATSALGAAFTFLTSPIGLVVLAIGAIIAIGALLITHWDEVEKIASDVWNSVTAKFQEFDNFLNGVFSTDWTEAFGAFGNIINSFSVTVSDVWTSIKNIFSGIVDFVAGVFTGDWSRAWSGVVSVFGGVFGGIAAIAKAPINGIIGLINMAIDGINSIQCDIPKWVPFVGGQHWGADLGHIEYLANGGIVNKPVKAWIGEGKDSEAVIPLNNKSVTPLADMISSKIHLSDNINGIVEALQNMQFNVNVDGTVEGAPFVVKANQGLAILSKKGMNKW